MTAGNAMGVLFGLRLHDRAAKAAHHSYYHNDHRVDQEYTCGTCRTGQVITAHPQKRILEEDKAHLNGSDLITSLSRYKCRVETAQG